MKKIDKKRDNLSPTTGDGYNHVFTFYVTLCFTFYFSNISAKTSIQFLDQGNRKAITSFNLIVALLNPILSEISDLI